MSHSFPFQMSKLQMLFFGIISKGTRADVATCTPPSLAE